MTCFRNTHSILTVSSLYVTCVLLFPFRLVCPPEQRAHCAICADRIWGLGRQGYKCINCKLLVHKKCHKLVTVECGRQMIQVRNMTINVPIHWMLKSGCLTCILLNQCSVSVIILDGKCFCLGTSDACNTIKSNRPNWTHRLDTFFFRHTHF